MRDPRFISTTSQLTDDEANLVNEALQAFEQDHGYSCAILIKTKTGWAANIRRIYRADWDHLWGRWKTKLFRARIEAGGESFPDS